MLPTSSNCRPNSSSIAAAWRALLNSVEVTAEDSVAIDLGRAAVGHSPKHHYTATHLGFSHFRRWAGSGRAVLTSAVGNESVGRLRHPDSGSCDGAGIIPDHEIRVDSVDLFTRNVEGTLAASPMKRAGKPEDIAAAYVTGQTISVNGGRYLV